MSGTGWGYSKMSSFAVDDGGTIDEALVINNYCILLFSCHWHGGCNQWLLFLYYDLRDFHGQLARLEHLDEESMLFLPAGRIKVLSLLKFLLACQQADLEGEWKEQAGLLYGCSWRSPLDGDGEHGKQGSEVDRVIARRRGMNDLKSQNFCLSIRRGGGGVTKYREMWDYALLIWLWGIFQRMAIASIINKRISLVCGSGTRGVTNNAEAWVWQSTGHRIGTSACRKPKCDKGWGHSISKSQVRRRLRPT